jgi:hypothetical protein
MAEQAVDRLAAREAALASGDWAAARVEFGAVAGQGGGSGRSRGLAPALWWTDGSAQAIAERRHAYSGYRRRGEDAAAAHWVCGSLTSTRPLSVIRLRQAVG